MQNAPSSQSPGIFRKKVGDIVVTALLDGMLTGDFGMLLGIDEAEIKRDMADVFRTGKPTLSISCFAVQTRDKTIMIDSGCGTSDMFVGGRLPEALNAAGISPDAVDFLIASHLHPDHVGGFATNDGRAYFKNAELLVHADEAKFWLETENPPEEMKPFFAGARAAVEPYRASMRTFSKGELTPGIEAEPLPGHTPGHTGFHISSGSDSLVIWTDIVHLPFLQAKHPEVGIAFDLDPEQAKAQRRRLFDKVATDRLLVAGPHMDFPTFAHLERRGTGYAFVPEPWLPTL